MRCALPINRTHKGLGFGLGFVGAVYRAWDAGSGGGNKVEGCHYYYNNTTDKSSRFRTSLQLLFALLATSSTSANSSNTKPITLSTLFKSQSPYVLTTYLPRPYTIRPYDLLLFIYIYIYIFRLIKVFNLPLIIMSEDLIDSNGSKRLLKEIKPLDPFWSVDQWFRSRPLWKSQHAIDSYNQFLSSKENGIQYIIQRENPQQILKEPINEDQGLFKYEISIYYGAMIESLDDEGNPDKMSDQNHIYISSPIEYTIDPETGENHSQVMWPNIARLKGYTYGSSVLADIAIVFKNNQNGENTFTNLSKASLGTVPIMVRSNRVLNGLDPVKLTDVKDPYVRRILLSKLLERLYHKKKDYEYPLIETMILCLSKQRPICIIKGSKARNTTALNRVILKDPTKASSFNMTVRDGDDDDEDHERLLFR